MRKRLIGIILGVLAATVPSAAQEENMALGCPATASSEVGAHTADKAVDGNPAGDSRWESRFDGDDADDQWWSVDLREPREFDMIQIVWEGAYARRFRIEAANAADFSDAVTIVERDEQLTSLTRTYDLAAAVTARYVRFVGIERALPYGYSFFEFGVYKKTAPVVTRLTAVASADMCRLGGSVTIDCAAEDQYGAPMAVGEVSYEVSPADAGVFNSNVYTPLKTGTAVITVRSAGVAAPPVEVVGYDGSNVAAADKVTGHNDEADVATMGLAFDGNEGPGEWVLHGNTGDSEAERTYDAWFAMDLGKDYAVSMVSVCFEGASSSAYAVSFSADGETWTEAVSVTHPAGINAWKDRLGRFTADASRVRYVRFWSTQAATQYGVKVREFSVFGRAVDGEIVRSAQPDATTGAFVLDGELNEVTAAFFDEDNAMAYDMRSVMVKTPMAITPLNPNAMFIVTEEQKTSLAGTPNLVTVTADGYASDRITLRDGSDVNTLLTVRAAEVSYVRAASDELQTLVVPFATAVPADLRAYSLVDRTSSGLLFQETLTLTAGTPYIISGNRALELTATDAVVDFTCTTDSGDDAAFTGTYRRMTAAEAGTFVYVLDDKSQFRLASATAEIPPFRAWVTAEDASMAKMGVVFGDVTGFERIAGEVAAPETVKEFSLGGIRTTGRGIVVTKGRKSVRK